MKGHFLQGKNLPVEQLGWGSNTWHSNPSLTQARKLAVVEVNLQPGGGHHFHHHPNQEEVIYVIEGEIEQWVEQESRILGKGDSAFIPAGMVHASFNVSNQDAKFMAILGPCIGDAGYEIEEVHESEPWKSLK
ncbi:MAG: cupin domain-containing protein [Bacteroidota bacterium]